MKKLVLFIGVLSMPFLNAQDITDALRYSNQDILGTARYRGMSGAFGALGGDLSAIQINPAGSAVFLNSSGSITLSSGNIDNDTHYRNSMTSASSNTFNFNQLGAVFVYDNNDQSSPLNKLSFSIAYDQTADNRDEFSSFGRSNTSIDNFFLSEAQGIQLDLLTVRNNETVSQLYSILGEDEGYGTQQAFLGHESFLIEANDLDDLDNTSYFSNIAPGFFDQEYFYESTGLNGKFTVNGGAQINERFYVGVNLSSHFINYDRVTKFIELNNNTDSFIVDVEFDNRLSTVGSGFSAQIGGIAKVSKMLRLGLSFESPTWYYIEEETTQRLRTIDNTGADYDVNPNVINIFPEYQLRTPGKATGSIAVLFGKLGLISLDYSYKDYTSTEFDSDFGENFYEINRAIENNLQGASTIRIGGELRNGNWSFRGGYSYEESPYKEEFILGEKTGFSIGIGHNFGQFKFDIAYDYSEQERNQQFYPNSGFSNAVSVDSYRDNLTFTLGLNF